MGGSGCSEVFGLAFLTVCHRPPACPGKTLQGADRSGWTVPGPSSPPRARAPSAIREHALSGKPRVESSRDSRCLFETRWVEVTSPGNTWEKSREEPGGRFGRRKKGGLRRDPPTEGPGRGGDTPAPNPPLKPPGHWRDRPWAGGLAAGLVPEMTLSLFIHLFIHFIKCLLSSVQL